jgi:hypothetical protein
MAAMVQAVSAQGASQWAQVEFGHTELGHGARTKRAVLMAQAMLLRSMCLLKLAGDMIPCGLSKKVINSQRLRRGEGMVALAEVAVF